MLDLRNRYRGSVLGPFWMTASAALMLVGLGLLYSRLFGISLRDYLPHLAVSLITWNVISGLVADACTALTNAEGIIRQIPLPFTVHALRCVFRNALTAAHNLPLLLVVLIALGQWPGIEIVLLLPGLLILGITAFAVSLLLGMLCARFRDVGQIVGNVMQLAFFLTPILWKPELLGPAAIWLPLNPFYAMLEMVRGPLIEGGGSPIVWAAASFYALVLVAVAFAFFVRFRGRVAFWV